MRSIETFHHNFTASGSHTFDLKCKPFSVVVKNLTSDSINFSFGKQIDTDNDSYSILPKGTWEKINYSAVDDDDNVFATVEASGTGMVEIRILEY